MGERPKTNKSAPVCRPMCELTAERYTTNNMKTHAFLSIHLKCQYFDIDLSRPARNCKLGFFFSFSCLTNLQNPDKIIKFLIIP